jgi:DNA repair exonuclease SbcCD nuclease subunit
MKGNNMKYGLMADLHLHRWSSFSGTTPEGLNSRLHGLLSEIERCAAEVHEAGGQHVVLAGDVFHVRGSITPSVLNPTKDMLAHCHTTYGTEFHILAGNHDLEGRNSERLGSAITALECGYVRVFNDYAYLDQLNAVLVPWHEETAKLKSLLEKIAAVDTAVTDTRTYDLIIHAPIDGVIEGLPLHGLEPSYLASLGFRRVFSGHYHNHKVMEEGKVISIGALAHHSWSDIKSKAGFLLVDSESSHFEWRASQLPQFIDMNELVDMDPEDIELVIDGNYVRMRVEADKSKEVEAARGELVGMGAKGVLIQAQPKQAVREGEVAATVSSGASLEASLTAWVRANLDPSIAGAVGLAAIDVLSATSSMEA